MTESLNFFATAPKGLEPLLADELRALGAREIKEARAGVSFAGGLETAYRACLWSRLANRVLLPIARFPAPDADALYAGIQSIDWRGHLSADGTLAIDASVSGSAITHSQFAAQKAKDAIVDQFRAASGRRPDVELDAPDLRVNLYLLRDEATVSIDLSGDSLHRRGYRIEGREAPLKENLACAILLRAGWPQMARQGGAFVDPMCGSGTLAIEAALMAADVAPGLARRRFGFTKWPGHDEPIWRALLEEAQARRADGMTKMQSLAIAGFDSDTAAIRAALANCGRAGLARRLRFERRALADCASAAGEAGLLCVNPPYGERLGAQAELPALYSDLGRALKQCYPGWRASILLGDAEYGRLLGLRAHKRHALYNGALACTLLHFEIPQQAQAAAVDGSAQAFANRLKKNLRHFGRWARREGIACYRLYDADLHNYNLAIDVYETEPASGEAASPQRRVHVQEYQAPDSIDPRLAQRRLAEALAVIPEILEIPAERMYYKRRRRQKGGTQYEKLGERGELHVVREGACRFYVNFTDYLDTGLFLDHRQTRAMLGARARGERFLNLFGYTGTATVHAALGGAAETTTVDMSRPYLDWAGRNFELNRLPAARHRLVHADALTWLDEPRAERFDLIFLDPPSFSRSKRMTETLDVVRDHAALITAAARLLDRDGVLIFSTNLRGFKLARAALSAFEITDITRATVPKDFERRGRAHACFEIKPRRDDTP